MTSKNKFGRRKFLETTAMGLAGFSILYPMNSCTNNDNEECIKLGFIGLGRQAMYLLKGFINLPGVQVVAGCDVYGRKRTRFERLVKGYYSSSAKKNKVSTYLNFKDLIAREDIDAVVIATPDHWHALIAIEACKAGKDIYLEKPMTFTIKEGQELIKAVRENNVVLAIGSQQRSDPAFQKAVKLVQNGDLGNIEKVHAYVGAPPIPYNLPAMEVPDDLDWDFWLGPLPGNIHFNDDLNPPIYHDPLTNEKVWGAWRWYKEMGGGYTTDWGAHMFDIVQWALGMDKNGPVQIAPISDGTEYMKFTYSNGVIMTTEPFDKKMTKGVKFIGDKGWVEVSRDHFAASNTEWIPKKNIIMDESPLELKIPHQINFIEAVSERKDPLVPVEIGHSSCTVCTLGNIACDLGRTLNWDPSTQTFLNDDDGKATEKLHYKYRKPWILTE